MSDRIIKEAEAKLMGIPLKVVNQGAEATVFVTSVHPYLDKLSNSDKKFIIKYRPRKLYRHPKIDRAITKSRTIGEVKIMHKLYRTNIPCPRLISTDFENGIIWMEHVGDSLPTGEICSLKQWLWSLETNVEDCKSGRVKAVCVRVGELIAKLHINEVIHGDLTTSNLVLESDKPIIIDFGLSSVSNMAEDKAVDLYVLQRAILSTHANFADLYNSWILEGYTNIHLNQKNNKLGTKALQETIKKLDDVSIRGRKRSMIG